jgi:hypothetical protein
MPYTQRSGAVKAARKLSELLFSGLENPAAVLPQAAS